MTEVMINKEICTGCGLCVTDCSRKAITLVDEKAEVDLNKCNQCGHCFAICPFGSVSMPLYDDNEITEFNEEKIGIQPDNFLNFLKFRRSIRQFKDIDPEPEKVNKIIEAGRYSPTASNRQMNRFIIIKDKLNEVRSMALKTLYDMGNDPKCIDEASWSLYHKTWIKMYEDYKERNVDGLFFNAPEIICIVSEEKSGFADVNGGIAGSRMELQANSMGLGVCYIGFFKRAVKYNEKLRELLGMKENEEFILCFVLGYPDVKYQRPAGRKPADVRYI